MDDVEYISKLQPAILYAGDPNYNNQTLKCACCLQTLGLLGRGWAASLQPSILPEALAAIAAIHSHCYVCSPANSRLILFSKDIWVKQWKFRSTLYNSLKICGALGAEVSGPSPCPVKATVAASIPHNCHQYNDPISLFFHWSLQTTAWQNL